MTRLLVPLATPDISAFGKTLKSFLDERHAAGKPLPSHLELLNLLARTAGLRNYATLKALVQRGPGDAPAPAQDPAVQQVSAAAVDLSSLSPTVRKALIQFDSAGRLVRVPNKLSVNQMSMWALWTRFTARRKYSEKEINAVLQANHTFGDHATLRRELVNLKLLGRKSDCSAYWKEAQRPGSEVQSFLRAWRAGAR